MQLTWESPGKCKSPNLEDFQVLFEYASVLGKILGLPQKREINFFINLMFVIVLVSKTPYRMGTPTKSHLCSMEVCTPQRRETITKLFVTVP